MTRVFPFLAIAAVFAWAGLTIALRPGGTIPPEKKVIRIAHWQLEPGIREAFKEFAAEYEKMHPDVLILQDSIPDSTYPQWLTTQLIGGTAPDIVEAGMLPPNLLTTYYLRYFLPLTPYVLRPNPYNAGTDLSDVPFFKTYRDGMRSAFIDEAQQFMNIPLSAVGMRLLYNRDLLKRLTGHETPPRYFREFLDVCREIARQKDAFGRYYIPIANSAYHLFMWDNSLLMPATYTALELTDFNPDGRFAKEEMFLGFVTGTVDLNLPAYQARLKILKDLTPFFPAGYTGLNRDDAVMLFAKQRSVFISIGTWDAASLIEQAKGRFTTGFVDFPLPSSTDPEYGAFFPGPRWEPVLSGNLPFAITRTSKHPDIAADFLLYLASKSVNERFNAKIGWIPAIQGAKTAPSLQAFEPNYVGIYPAFDPNIGPESTVRWSQLFSLFQVGQISIEDFSREFQEFYTTTGRRDFEEMLREMRRGLLRDEHLAVQLRVRAIHEDPQDFAAAPWVRYRRAVLGRSMNMHAYVRMLEADATEKSLRFFSKPNSYSATARDRILRRVNSPLANPGSATP